MGLRSDSQQQRFSGCHEDGPHLSIDPFSLGLGLSPLRAEGVGEQPWLQLRLTSGTMLSGPCLLRRQLQA
jgi:hypothetical protein